MPAFVRYVFEKNSVSLIRFLRLVYIDMVNWLFEIALKRNLWVIIWNVDVDLESLPFVGAIFWCLNDYCDLLDKLKAIQKDFVETLKKSLILFQH